MDYGSELRALETPIPGLLLFQLPVHGDNRGWFKENWQREKMLELGLPDFGPVQNNISYNSSRGTTRGIHAEPWDKYISVATGSVFGAWVDLRPGASFGAVFTTVLNPSTAIFVPRGVANSFQTLEEETAYTYLVNDHWSADAQSLYTFVNLADPTLKIDWPIPLSESVISEKDLNHPLLADVSPMMPKKTLVLGANGQLGRALRKLAVEKDITHWHFADRSTIDLFDRDSLSSVPWSEYETVINAAAFTRVDDAETAQGRQNAWAVNATAVSEIARHCRAHNVTLLHVSTDYVFDGTSHLHNEDEPLTPLGVYGQSKAAGEMAVRALAKHYVLRTSWVVGDGANFIETMASLAKRGVEPHVVNDQCGRLTFADDLALGIEKILTLRPEYGVYNISNDGDPATWFDIAARVFETLGRPTTLVHGVSTEQYFSSSETPVAPRPLNSTFSLDKLRSSGISMPDQWVSLSQYLARRT